LWEADNLSSTISIELGNYLQQYNSKLDIIYQDALGLGNTREYKSIIYSNSSAIVSKPPQETTSKQNTDGTPNAYLFLVLIIISTTFVVATSSKFYLNQTKTKNIKKIRKLNIP
jgi:hypothetical protein